MKAQLSRNDNCRGYPLLYFWKWQCVYRVWLHKQHKNTEGTPKFLSVTTVATTLSPCLYQNEPTYLWLFLCLGIKAVTYWIKCPRVHCKFLHKTYRNDSASVYVCGFSLVGPTALPAVWLRAVWVRAGKLGVLTCSGTGVGGGLQIQKQDLSQQSWLCSNRRETSITLINKRQAFVSTDQIDIWWKSVRWIEKKQFNHPQESRRRLCAENFFTILLSEIQSCLFRDSYVHLKSEFVSVATSKQLINHAHVSSQYGLDCSDALKDNLDPTLWCPSGSSCICNTAKRLQ